MESKLGGQIEELVRKYYKEYHEVTKKFSPGDRISYSGRVYDADEMVNLVDAALEFWLTSGHYRAVDKPPNFVNVTRYHDKTLTKIAEIFQRKRSWFPMPWPLSSF